MRLKKRFKSCYCPWKHIWTLLTTTTDALLTKSWTRIYFNVLFMHATQHISCVVYSTYYVSTTMWCFVNFAQLKPEENNKSWTWAFWWNKRLAREMISVPWNFGRGVNELSVMLSFNGNPVDVTRWRLGAWNADGFFLSFELALDDLSLKWNLRCVLKVFSLKLLFWWFWCIILTQKSNT